MFIRSIHTLLAVILSIPLMVGQLTITVESGIVSPGYNDVRAPNSDTQQGSLFSLSGDFREIKNPIYFRAEAMLTFNSKHTFELTAAPLVIESKDFNNESELLFENLSFTGNSIDGRYQFNTYRFSYRYRLLGREKFMLDLGGSVLVRDASISITQGGVAAENTDLGFVPLISLHTAYAFNPSLSIMLKGDALVGPVGRAEDFFLGLRYAPLDHISFRLGYRIIEGGADVDQVYNFALFQFAAGGLVVQF